MREMKESGIEWIGKIPKTWKIIKVKDGFNRKNEKAHQIDPIVLSLARDGVKVRDITTNEGQLAASYFDYNPVEPGDMMINPMDLISGANCALSKIKGVISPAYVNLKHKENFEPRFYDYYFKYQYWCKAFFAHGKGVSFENRWTLNNETLMNYPLVEPSYDEQKNIANLLDNECSKIDRIKNAIAEQIEMLKQYKQSLITKVVTKGLNPNVEMKDSGVERIGKIPHDWKITKVKYHIGIENGSDPKMKGEIPVYGSGAYSFKTCGEFKIGPTVLLGRKGATLHIPHYIEGKYWNVDTAFNTIANNTINLKFFYYLSNCFDYKYYISQTTLPGMTQTNYGNMKIPFPDLNQQLQIVDYLDEKCFQIDSIISDKEKQLETLEQYKKSLIYEYVTGKKEVPHE